MKVFFYHNLITWISN